MSSIIDVKDLLLDLDFLGKNVKGEGLRKALEGAGLVYERGIKARIRRQDAIDTGTMLNSVHSAVNIESSTSGIVVAGTAVEYDIFVEFGTVKMAARPFIRPTQDEDTPAAINAMVASLEKQIKRRR